MIEISCYDTYTSEIAIRDLLICWIRNNPDVEPDIHAIVLFTVAKNNDELENRTQEFDRQIYNKKIRLFRMPQGLTMKNKASESVVKEIVNRQYIKRT